MTEFSDTEGLWDTGEPLLTDMSICIPDPDGSGPVLKPVIMVWGVTEALLTEEEAERRERYSLQRHPWQPAFQLSKQSHQLGTRAHRRSNGGFYMSHTTHSMIFLPY